MFVRSPAFLLRSRSLYFLGRRLICVSWRSRGVLFVLAMLLLVLVLVGVPVLGDGAHDGPETLSCCCYYYLLLPWPLQLRAAARSCMETLERWEIIRGEAKRDKERDGTRGLKSGRGLLRGDATTTKAFASASLLAREPGF